MVDVIVVGGGPAGYHSALKAAQSGLKTVLISDTSVGGVCLHSGCIPSKTLLHSTNLSRDHAQFAIYGGPHPVDLPVLRERISSIVTTLERGILGQLTRAGVTLFEESAEILPKRDRFFVVKAGSEVIMSKYLILATGSKEQTVEIPGINTAHVVTITEIFANEPTPLSLLIIGAGSIGLEIGTAFARMGSDVTIIEQGDRIGSSFDHDLTRILERELVKEGITIHTGTSIERIHNRSIDLIKGNQRFTITADRILPATGRTARIDIEGVHSLSIELTHEKAIATSPFGETSEAGCYAVGDLSGSPMLAHAAYSEAERAIDHILGRSISVDKPAIPMVLYTNPELASVGLSEQQAKDAGMPVKIRKRPLGGNGRFLAETSGERGVCKVVIHSETGVILGVHLAMPHASELITAAVVMVAQKLTAADLANCIFPHPTMGEIIKQCIVEES